MKQESWDRRHKTGDVRQETWDSCHETGDMRLDIWDRRRETGDRRHETEDVRYETWFRIHETGDMIQETWYKRHDTRDIIEETWYKRQGPSFLQLTTKHSDTRTLLVTETFVIDYKHVSDRLRNIVTLPVRRNYFSNSVGTATNPISDALKYVKSDKHHMPQTL